MRRTVATPTLIPAKCGYAENEPTKRLVGRLRERRQPGHVVGLLRVNQEPTAPSGPGSARRRRLWPTRCRRPLLEELRRALDLAPRRRGRGASRTWVSDARALRTPTSTPLHDLSHDVDTKAFRRGAALITGRRTTQPWGMAGGGPGAIGQNWLLPGGDEGRADKCTVQLRAGDVLRMRTPGGGYGAAP